VNVLLVGLVVAIVLLVPLLAWLVANANQREIRRKLGLPVEGKLTPEQMKAFRAFENTDMKLKQKFPTMSDRQRQLMVRELVNANGMQPKKRKAA
jgi:hypothetical protein